MIRFGCSLHACKVHSARRLGLQGGTTNWYKNLFKVGCRKKSPSHWKHVLRRQVSRDSLVVLREHYYKSLSLNPSELLCLLAWCMVICSDKPSHHYYLPLTIKSWPELSQWRYHTIELPKVWAKWALYKVSCFWYFITVTKR